MSKPGDHARLTATAHARETLAAGGHVITPRLEQIFRGATTVSGKKLAETWVGHCLRCGESFAMTLRNGVWKADGMVFVWTGACRGEWRHYYYEEEPDYRDGED